METVLALGMNPKHKKKRAKRNPLVKGARINVGGRKIRTNPRRKKSGGRSGSIAGYFKGEISHLPKDAIGVTMGLLAADVGVNKIRVADVNDPNKNRWEGNSYTDVGVSVGVSLAAGYLGRKFLGERGGIAAYHGGLTVSMQKLLGTGETEPLGDKIQAGYGGRLRSMFAGPKDDVIFIPAGIGDTYNEEGTLADNDGAPVVTE